MGKIELLDEILKYANDFPSISRGVELRRIIELYSTEAQIDILKRILNSPNLSELHTTALYVLTDKKYNSVNSLTALFEAVKNDVNHLLRPNLPHLAHITAILSENEPERLAALSLLEEALMDNPNEQQIIDFLGQILQNHSSVKQRIIDFLSGLNVNNDAKTCILFYTTLEDKNRILLKQHLKSLILDKNEKKKRSDNLRILCYYCENCPDNTDLIDFLIVLVKNLPLKNPIHRKTVWGLHRFFSSMVDIGYKILRTVKKRCFKLIPYFILKCFTPKHLALKYSVKMNKFLRKIICNIFNIFTKGYNAINNKYYNHRFIFLENSFAKILKEDQYPKVLKAMKQEQYGPILLYLAYQMSYPDYCAVYHPVKTQIKGFYTKCQYS